MSICAAPSGVRHVYIVPLLRFNRSTSKLVNFAVQRHYSDASVVARASKERHGIAPRHASDAPKAIAKSGLEKLPTFNIVRSLLLGTFFTSPLLFRVGFGVFEKITRSKSPLLSPDRNPILRAVIKPFVYDQFCAGTNQSEIFKSRDLIKRLGYSGIILCYGKEIQVPMTKDMGSTSDSSPLQSAEIKHWRDGNLETLDMIGEGDWLGMKITGAGSAITNILMQNQAPPPEWVEAMDAIAQKAASKNCRIWIDAEQSVVQQAIDSWTIDFMRKYNRNGKVVIYNTLQAYLKASRQKLKDQLALADQEGWQLAIKLVRGAYIANDYREKIHDTKQDTDDSYNGIVRDVLTGQNLGFSEGRFPRMQLFLAGHNPDSVSRAWNLIQSLSAEGRLQVLPDFGQLQGMADELGCKVVQRCEDLAQAKSEGEAPKGAVVPRVYKCLTWGSIQECMEYLLRRIVENRGGADRMRDGMSAYWAELKRRMVGRRV